MGKQQEFFVLPHRKGQGQGQLQGQQHERKQAGDNIDQCKVQQHHSEGHWQRFIQKGSTDEMENEEIGDVHPQRES